MHKILKFLVFLLIFSSFVFSGEKIVVGVELEPDRINPLYDEDHDPTLQLVFSGLTNHDEHNKIIPELAKEWKVSEDGLEYTFILRDDVFWHDGVKFGVDDVIFTIKSAMDKKLNAPAISNYENVKSVEKLNENSLKVTLKEPFPPFLDALSFGMIPKHILENKDISKDKFNSNPVGTGPYKVSKWKKGEFIEFVANNNFYKNTPKIKNVFLKIIPDAKTRFLQLKSGDIDVAMIDSSFVNLLQNDEKIKILRFKSADYRALMFNFKNEIFKDQNVRIALNYFINKDEIVKNVLHDYGFKINNPLALFKFAKNSKFVYEYNPKKGDEILKKSGWNKNKKGIYEKNGKTLSFDIYSFNSDPLRVTLANVISNEFNKFGINTKAYAKPKTAFRINEVDSFMIGWGSPFDADFHTYRIFGSFNDIDINENGWNYNHYADKDVDATLKKARNTQNKAKREEAYKEFLEAIYKNPPYIFIANIDYPLAYNKNVSGIKTQILGHHGAGFLWNLSEWDIK